MPTKEEIESKYRGLHQELELEFFDYKERGRQPKVGKARDEHNQRHAQLWKAFEAEMIAAGFMEAPPTPPLSRDLASELDALEARVLALEG